MAVEIAVASTIYNLAGPVETRPNYLKVLTTRNLFAGGSQSMADAYNKGFLNGPSSKIKAFYRWTRTGSHYDQIGVPDATIAGITDDGFFPFIPVRMDNQFLSTSYLPDAFAQVREAYRKLTDGARIEDLIAKLADNPDIGDIDYMYVVVGVPISARDKESMKYIYMFFDALRYSQTGGPSASGTLPSTPDALELSNDVTPSFSRSYYRIKITWRRITEVTGSGLGKVGAKVGEFWWDEDTAAATKPTLRLWWQRSETTYTHLRIIDPVHYNFVYGEDYVLHAWHNMFQEEDEDPDPNFASGFVLPLHYGIWRSTGLVPTTQLATQCSLLVLNCYEIHKKAWYEQGIFQVILVVAIAIVSVVFTGGAGIGLLGANLALGSALGFTGMTAAIVGSVVNALAAMVLVSLLQPVLQQAGALGPIIGAVLMFAIGQISSSITSTGTMVINWGDLLRADNLLAMTNAVGQGISLQINQDSLGLQQEALDYVDNANAEISKIQQAFFEEFGYGAGIIDPSLLVDGPTAPIAESASTFLTRTLMTGSEVAEMSRQLLYEFPTYSLKLPDAFT